MEPPGYDKWFGVKGSARAACPPVYSLHHFWASFAFLATNYNNAIVILWSSRDSIGPSIRTIPFHLRALLIVTGSLRRNSQPLRQEDHVLSITEDDWLAAGRPACHLLEAAGGCGNSRCSITWTPRWWWSTSRPQRKPTCYQLRINTWVIAIINADKYAKRTTNWRKNLSQLNILNST